MATSRPSITPVITPLYMRQLELTIILNLYRMLHGGDPFNSGEVGTEAATLGLVSYLDQQNIGTTDKIVENLAKLNIKLRVTIDGKTTEVKSTKQYRDLSIDQPGPLKSVQHCLQIEGTDIMYCYKLFVPFDITQH